MLCAHAYIRVQRFIYLFSWLVRLHNHLLRDSLYFMLRAPKTFISFWPVRNFTPNILDRYSKLYDDQKCTHDAREIIFCG